MRAVRRERNHAETDHDAERVGIAWEEAQVGIEARVAPGRQRVGAVRWDVLNRRAARWYLGVTLTLTAVGGLLTWLVVPPTGLVRSVYADVSFAGEPLSQARTPDISLAFLDEDPTLPRRFFSVEWRGFWFLPRAQAVDLYVGADDRVDILVDGQLAHRRNLSLGMGTTRETVTLGAGPHTVAIRYAQDGGGMHLNVQRAFRGGPPAPFAPTRLFPNVPDTQDVLLTTGTPWLLRVVALLWLIPFMRLMRLGWRIVGRPAVRAWQRAVGALPDSPLPALPWPQRLAIVLFPALLGPLQLVVFGPHHLYASNLAEFSAPFWSLAPYGLPVVGLTSGLLVLLGLLVPRRRFPAYVTALFTVGLLLWIQGNLIVGDYGLLDGQPLDFARHDWRTPYELALWIGVPALAITAARTVVPIAVTGSRLLVLLQTVVLGASAVQVSDAVPQWQGPPEAVFELSAHRNVLHIVLDTFQSDTFLEIAQADRDEVDRRFAGFEFFVDHAGAFPTTYLSIPAMLTGAAYRNTEPIPAFIENQFDQESLFSLLGEAGYDIDYLSGLSMGRHATNAYRIARPYTTYRDYTRFTTWQLIDLAMFRHAPHVLKPWIYNGQAWRLQTSVGAGQSSDTIASRLPPVNGQVFFEEFTRRMTVARDRPVYKFLHVMIPHPPIALNEHCAVVDLRAFTRENYTGQARCAVRIVMRFLDRLRALGVYDDSLIIVSSDHGAALPPRQMPSEVTPAGDLAVMTGRAMALLLVKPPQREGPLRVSTAPTAITDIPATILDLLGLPSDQLPGIPASRLAADSPRERTYASYGWRNEDWQQSYFSYLDIFSLTGRLTDPRAWRFVETIYDPTTALEDRARGLFNAERDGRGESFRWTGATAAWAGPPDARGFTIQLRATAPMPQHVRLTVGGEEVGELALDDHAWHTLRVPVPLTESTTKGVRVDLVVEPTWRPEGNRRLGVMTRHVEWTTRP